MQTIDVPTEPRISKLPVELRVSATADELLPEFDASLGRLIPPPFLRHHCVIPIARRNDRLIVATSDALADVPELAEVLGARSVEYRSTRTTTPFRRRSTRWYAF